jgi:hypothetical protein
MKKIDNLETHLISLDKKILVINAKIQKIEEKIEERIEDRIEE